MSRHRNIAPTAVVLLVALASTACVRTHLQAGLPRDLFLRDTLRSIQIGRTDGSIILLRRPQLTRDTVWGAATGDAAGVQTGVAVRDIGWAMSRSDQFDGRKLVAFAVFTLVLPVVLIFAALAISSIPQ